MADRHKILMVDDDPDMLKSSKMLLETADYDVAVAEGGAQGILRLESEEFDLVLLDMNMPDVDGEQVLKFINDKKINLAVVVLSGETDFDHVTGAFQLGAFDYVKKPYEFDELKMTLKNAIRKLEIGKSMLSLRKKLERSERLHRFMIESSPDIIIIVDKNGNFAFVNDRAEDLLNYKKDELIGEHYSTIIDPEYLERASHCFNERRAGPRATRDAEIWLMCKPGNRPGWIRNRIAIELNSLGVYENEVRDNSGEVNASDYSGTYVVARDITERLASEKLIHFQAYHDLLTGLPNRALFHDRLTNTISNARREDDKLAILFLDLDRFKVVNDTLGHSVGDELLKQLANRLKACLREGDTVARLGGDEFIVLFPNVESESVAELVGRKLIDTIKEPFVVEGNELFVTGSIGISIYPEDGNTADLLIKNSDTAMYFTKERGKNNFNRYNKDMSIKHSRMLHMEADIRKGIKKGQFEVYYQPQVSSANDEIVGMEALLRWNHPKKGLLSPKFFMTVAEESGIIIELGNRVLETAVAEAKGWLDAGLTIDKLAVNFSNKQIEQDNFVDKIVSILKEHKFPGERLEIEITESILMNNVESTIEKLDELHKVGVSVAIDDFGIGYSSLSLLQKLPIHRLKIDRSFIHDMVENEGHSIIEAIAYMARGLKIEMVAEGVELDYQLRYLRSLDCPVIQRFLYSRAVPAHEARNLIQESNAAHTTESGKKSEKVKKKLSASAG
ncbi:MAG: EAL domain-containing protein [Gammaproteobacteria bacterium]|nr:EAL domain-containing protein [Gammaproteobacteria bacterium]